jgi:hypothetical protein
VAAAAAGAAGTPSAFSLAALWALRALRLGLMLGLGLGHSLGLLAGLFRLGDGHPDLFGRSAGRNASCLIGRGHCWNGESAGK